MAELERWTLLVAGPGEIIGYKAPGGSRILTTNPRMDAREVEVVPDEQLRGAVGALERIADLDEEYGEETAAGEIALGALVALGVRPATSGGRYVCESCGDAEPDGVKLIAAERRRQVDAEGWTPEHDDAHTHYELAKAGAAYALYGGFGKMSVDIRDLVWPWEPESFKPSRDRIRDLAKAGALIAAEIDRLHRLGGQ